MRSNRVHNTSARLRRDSGYLYARSPSSNPPTSRPEATATRGVRRYRRASSPPGGGIRGGAMQLPEGRPALSGLRPSGTVRILFAPCQRSLRSLRPSRSGTSAQTQPTSSSVVRSTSGTPGPLLRPLSSPRSLSRWGRLGRRTWRRSWTPDSRLRRSSWLISVLRLRRSPTRLLATQEREQGPLYPSTSASRSRSSHSFGAGEATGISSSGVAYRRIPRRRKHGRRLSLRRLWVP